MPLELMIILNRFPELTLEEAVNKLLTESKQTRTEAVDRTPRREPRKAPPVIAA